MKLYISLPKSLVPYYNSELKKYLDAYVKENYNLAWKYLERAHILGQKYPLAHTYVHWKMLQFGFKIKNRKEVIGQLPRLFFGGIKSFVGSVPVGNPGGASVPPLKPFPIEKELQDIFKKAGVLM